MMPSVEIIYSPKNGTIVSKQITYYPGLTIEKAIDESKIASLYPEVVNYNSGIFSSIAPKSSLVKPFDRIEIYRPLTVCPKEKRRKKLNRNKPESPMS